MQARWFLLLLLLYLSLVNICEAKKKRYKIPYVISKFFQKNSKPPIIFYFEPQAAKKRPKDFTDSFDWTLRGVNEDDDDDDTSLKASPNDEGAYILYHLLRTTLQTEDLDPKTADKLVQTKHILRQALRARCKKLNSCEKKCPEKKKSCTLTCKQIFDILNACKPKNECERPKCGKTMPPAWIL